MLRLLLVQSGHLLLGMRLFKATRVRQLRSKLAERSYALASLLQLRKEKKAVTRVGTAADVEGMAGSSDTKRGASHSTRTNDEEKSKTTSSKSGKGSKH